MLFASFVLNTCNFFESMKLKFECFPCLYTLNLYLMNCNQNLEELIIEMFNIFLAYQLDL